MELTDNSGGDCDLDSWHLMHYKTGTDGEVLLNALYQKPGKRKIEQFDHGQAQAAYWNFGFEKPPVFLKRAERRGIAAIFKGKGLSEHDY